MTKILFASRSKAHFSYYKTVIEEFVAQGHDIHIFFDKHWSNYGDPSHVSFDEWWVQNPEIPVGWFPKRKDIWRRPLMLSRELRTYNNYCTRGSDYAFYTKRWSYYLKLPPKLRAYVRRPFMQKILGSTPVRKLMTLIERVAPADKEILAWLRKLKPKAIVLSPMNMRFCEEIEIAKAARVLKIPVAVPVLSWDNMATKGLMHIAPKRLLAWHEGHAEEAKRFHNIGSHHIRLTGAPFFDKWFDEYAQVIPRSKFCAKVGLDSEKPFVLFLGSSANIAKDESWVVKELRQSFANEQDPHLKNVQVLFRAHPANWENKLSLLDEGVAVWPRHGTLPDSHDTFVDLRDSFEHCVAVVGINTSGMVDAVIYGKPVISPLIEQYSLTQDKADHFVRMRENGALYAVDGAAEICSQVGKLLAGDDPLQGKRVEFVARFIRPRGLDSSAGSMVVKEVIEMVATEYRLPEYEPNTKRTSSMALGERLVYQVPTEDVDTQIQDIFDSFWDRVDTIKNSDLYGFYQTSRDKIVGMMEHSEYRMSKYWSEEVRGFDYLFDASPLVVSKIREHCYHITGERGYNYRQHHQHKAEPFIDRLENLLELDNKDLFVPEAAEMGGFGFNTSKGMINTDTLKFYEVLIGLESAGFLKEFIEQPDERKAILEIGAGWGGFPYQFATLFPNTTCYIIDLPATLIFSVTYLRGMFPDAKMAIYGDIDDDTLFDNWRDYDFVFIPAQAVEKFAPRQLDIAVNMVSFQEMTTAQVSGYVDRLADIECRYLYSMNRDRSPHNSELSLVSEIIAQRFDTKPIRVLDTEYSSVGAKTKPKTKMSESTYRHIAGVIK